MTSSNPRMTTGSMNHRLARLASGAGVAAALVASLAASSAWAVAVPSASKVPIAFEENRGQVDPQVEYLWRGKDTTLFLARDGAAIALHTRGGHASGAAIRMALSGAKSDPCVQGMDQLPGRVNILRGSDPARWQRAIPTYARVRYEEVYPGIDLVFHGSEGELEYDFVVKPGADPEVIRLSLDGAEEITIDDHGNLTARAGGRAVVSRAPVAYQVAESGRVPVASRALLEAGEIGSSSARSTTRGSW